MKVLLQSRSKRSLKEDVQRTLQDYLDEVVGYEEVNVEINGVELEKVLKWDDEHFVTKIGQNRFSRILGAPVVEEAAMDLLKVDCVLPAEDAADMMNFFLKTIDNWDEPSNIYVKRIKG